MSSRDYIVTIYDMVIIRHHFSAITVIMSSGDYILGLYKDFHAIVEMKNYEGVNKKVRDL